MAQTDPRPFTSDAYQPNGGGIGGTLGFNVQPYLTGGLGVGWLHGPDGDAPANGGFGAGTRTVVGWTAGGGVEAMFNQK